jgi:IS30 family transposase
MIDQRPSVVDDRSRVGDWEMDTVIGRPGGPVLVAMVERVSRYTLIALAATKEALVVGAAIVDAMYLYRDKLITMTYDNGKEFAQHAQIAERLEANAYFAHPYHSWERGLNENTNGLIRQYFPKGSSFDHVTASDVKRVEQLLNTRPRKCLDYATPNDIFNVSPPIALAA